MNATMNFFSAVTLALTLALASHPDADIHVFEDCSLISDDPALQSAIEAFNAIPDAERFAICDAINPGFLKRFGGTTRPA